jgi:hypothetical protein
VVLQGPIYLREEPFFIVIKRRPDGKIIRSMVAAKHAIIQVKVLNHRTKFIENFQLIHHLPILPQTTGKVSVITLKHKGTSKNVIPTKVGIQN